MIKPRYNLSLDFLKKLAPQGPWTLTAVGVDRKQIHTSTFSDLEELLNWLRKAGSDCNIYYALNPLLRPVTQKASREDVAALAWLHVDIDPRAGEELEAEQVRALKLLRTPPGDVPPPTAIVFSGGGYQGIWKLSDPLKIDGEAAAYQEAARYNMQLELLFKADRTHNVDRILRLPGTVNRPDAKKRLKGREPTLAELVEWHDERVFPLDRFTPAALVQSSESVESRLVNVTGNVQRLGNIDELPESVSDRTKMLIVQGTDPDDPTKYPSRSEALFAVCCELVRAGVDDDTIFAVITDPDFRISGSVRDKGSNSERYAIRQIERAREHSEGAELLELNERHAVITNWGGKCVVVEEVFDAALQRHRLTKQSFGDIRNRYLNRKVKIGESKSGQPVYSQLGKWWLEHPHRRQYHTLCFAPGREVDGAYNLWKGFACEARPGDCELFLEHLRNNICCGDPERYEYLMGWMASAVQNPAQPGFTAVALRGASGVGKGFFAKTFGSLFGRHFLQVTDPKHLVGNFNSHLRDTVVLFADEAFYAGDKKHESILKALITEETLAIEAKGVDVEAANNYIHLILSSNEEWIVPAMVDDRRFLVLDVSGSRARDNRYFKAIQDQLDSGGREALLHYLCRYPLDDFQVRNPPQTAALQVQKMHSLGPFHSWWYEKLMDGRVFRHHGDWEEEVLTAELQDDCKESMPPWVRNIPIRLGMFLREACPRLEKVQKAQPAEYQSRSGRFEVIQRPYYYRLGSLEECRKIWDSLLGNTLAWPEAQVVASAGAADPPF